MAANYPRDDAPASRRPKAWLLRGEAISEDTAKLSRLLSCVGVDWEMLSIEEAASRSGGNSEERGERFCVMTSAACLAVSLDRRANAGEELPGWLAKAQSVYVYGFGEDTESRELLRLLTGDRRANVRGMTARQAFMSVTEDLPEMCGPMSGMQIRIQVPEKQSVFDLLSRSDAVQSVIGTNEGELLVGARCGATQFFLNASAEVLDVEARTKKYIDVRESFAEIVPVVMYARLAFGVGAQREINACLIVDDPPLKPRYGFMRYSQILGLMDEHNFATTIAFIPWNWSRTDASTVRLFNERPDRLSLCVHGCDHTAREFAERSSAILHKRVKIANQRMQLLRRSTRVPHANVMLFPQGIFSTGAARALKLNGFVAAANTEVVPVHDDEHQTTVGDLLQLAIMKYASFPVFTRRYLSHGVENFAFDGLLGKPCLIAAHHDDFAGEARILLQVVDRLNALNWNLRWRSLGDVIRRSFTTRKTIHGEVCVEMYGTHLIFQNLHSFRDDIKFLKQESDLDSVEAVMVNGIEVEHSSDGQYLRCEASVPPSESAELCIIYSDTQNLPASQDSFNYRARAVLRRYLSEFRDNYLSRNVLLQQQALRIKEALRL